MCCDIYVHTSSKIGEKQYKVIESLLRCIYTEFSVATIERQRSSHASNPNIRLRCAGVGNTIAIDWVWCKDEGCADSTTKSYFSMRELNASENFIYWPSRTVDAVMRAHTWRNSQFCLRNGGTISFRWICNFMLSPYQVNAGPTFIGEHIIFKRLREEHEKRLSRICSVLHSSIEFKTSSRLSRIIQLYEH